MARQLLFCVLALAAGRAQPQTAPDHPSSAPYQTREVLHYGIEWRLIHAGEARLSWTPRGGARPQYANEVHVESAGLVSRLYKVDNTYSAMLEDQLCATGFELKTTEAKRQRDTRVTIDRTANRATYVERDLLKNSVILQKQTDVPHCIPDVIGALYRMRTVNLPVGQSTQIPVTDGKKVVSAKVEAQEKEQIKTPAGTFNTVRYEVFLFNNVLFVKQGRLFVWLTDDPKRLPVQVSVRMRFYIGTINLVLEKQEIG